MQYVQEIRFSFPVLFFFLVDTSLQVVGTPQELTRLM